MGSAPVKCTHILLGSLHHVCSHGPRPLTPKFEHFWSWYRPAYPNRPPSTSKRSKGQRHQLQGHTPNPRRALSVELRCYLTCSRSAELSRPRATTCSTFVVA
ncbi:hypothetical protein BC827DRAFT_1216207 [Russula dissimulans]|nr:hypothetical protein BC827DRAFT_1216207 [Russula dissimulans]